MNLEILRLSHRIARDKRVSTHLALTSRALLANKLYYSGQKDSSLEDSIKKINNKFGSNFKIEHIKNPISLIKEKKKQGITILHLTVYGLELKKQLYNIKKLKKLLIIIGSEHVPSQYYEIADINLAITNQPHSELSSLAILLYELNKDKNINFKNAKIEIKPSEKGKDIIENEPN